MSDSLGDLHFKINNLGSIREGELIQRPLTVFCGPNNSGKTWAMYALYHCYRRLDDLIDLIKKNREGVSGNGKESPPDLIEFNDQFSKSIPGLFNAPPEKLAGARFEIGNHETWRQLVNGERHRRDIFLMPAERSGLHLFFRELSTRRTALLHHASKEDIDILELLRDVIHSRYAAPIADYINWLNNLADKQRSQAGSFHGFAEELKIQLADGAYKVDKSTGSIEFKPYQKKHDGKKTQMLGLHMTSSTVKSLFGLWFYLEHQAQKGDILMIDEPELNIHPENQRKIARLLARLVNAGLNIVISTHSDYIVRELNSLIMLNEDADKSLLKQYGYQDNEILNPRQIGAYLFDDHTVKPFEITPEDGIYATTFDKVIQDLNTVNDGIYYGLREQNGG